MTGGHRRILVAAAALLPPSKSLSATRPGGGREQGGPPSLASSIGCAGRASEVDELCRRSRSLASGDEGHQGNRTSFWPAGHIPHAAKAASEAAGSSLMRYTVCRVSPVSLAT
jgi:hypothetical protein